MVRPGSGRGVGSLQLLIVFVAALETRKSAEAAPETEPQYQVVHPTRVDAGGHFLSNFLSHHAGRVRRREASSGRDRSDRVFYQLQHGAHSLTFNLTLNSHLLAPGLLTERRYGGLEGARLHPPAASHCFFLGEVRGGATAGGHASISTCDGLTGLFQFSNEEFFIQPLETSSSDSTAPQPHAIYRRHAPDTGHAPDRGPAPDTGHTPYRGHAPSPPPSWSPVVQLVSGNQTSNGTCGLQGEVEQAEGAERRRERWELRQQKRRRRLRHRSVSREKWVETLVVADSKMVEYHGSGGVENYVLTVMNIVAGLFKDPSIGNAINIVVVRLILLEKDEDELKISHHADHSLSSFCKWQKQLNMKEEHPLHHDVAVLLTRKDICASVNVPCETLGLSHVAGMCQSHRSCSISEDTGLTLAFTVAHELGHNFGIQHDGNGNDCEPVGKRPFVMSPQLLYGSALPRWSRCSRQYITRFLDRGWGWCLDDAPVKDKLSLGSVLPGVLYSSAHQCRLQYGPGSVLCDDMDNVCRTLWCTVGTTCHSKLDGAVDGTSCGQHKWCVGGECVAVGSHPEPVDGGWGLWSAWSACSRSCGGGVQSAHRDCDDPEPKHRGKYCVGERRRYRVCSAAPCPQQQPSFRNLQCSHFNSVPYKGRLYRWEAVLNPVNPCELHCRPLNQHFSEKMRDAVIDGTPCHHGNKSRDMCVNGICKTLGCDYVIDSGAAEDRCGVCLGNGSTCTTVKKTFEEPEGLGYVDIGLIPEGARDVQVQEVSAAGNFLALRSDNKHFLNGGWTIQWNGEYKAAGTVFTYTRTGQLENLTSPGPTTEPLWIQILFQESNPGVRYEYTISQNISQDQHTPLFFWKLGSWTECSATCGTGVQRQMVHCVERTRGLVDEQFCDNVTRPDHNQTTCNKDPCPAMWWVGEWQTCSSSCGSSGSAVRSVQCVRSVGAERQEEVQPSLCQHTPRPASEESCNTHVLCPADWSVGSWSKCSVTCGAGVQRRNVTCSRNTGADCDPRLKPVSVGGCGPRDCPPEGENFGGTDWSGSGWPSKELLNEINLIPDSKPGPRSGGRSQPRTHNQLSNSLEDELHDNNMEKVRHNNVEVDDFYYDYNFINFHEDLSEDLEEDGQGLDQPQEKREDGFKEPPTDPPRAQSTDLDRAETENEDDFLSEDYLLPVSSTRSPTPSTDARWREGASVSPSVESIPEEPTQEVTQGEYQEEDYDYSSVTPTYEAPPTLQAVVSMSVATTVSAQEAEQEGEYEEYGYGYNVFDYPEQEESGTRDQVHIEPIESDWGTPQTTGGPLRTPTMPTPDHEEPKTTDQVPVKPDESERPQRTSGPLRFPTTRTPDHEEPETTDQVLVKPDESERPQRTSGPLRSPTTLTPDHEEPGTTDQVPVKPDESETPQRTGGPLRSPTTRTPDHEEPGTTGQVHIEPNESETPQRTGGPLRTPTTQTPDHEEPETTDQVTVKPYESERPQRTGGPLRTPMTRTLEDLTWNPTAVPDLAVTPAPSSHRSAPPPLTSGNQDASHESTSSAGTDITPPTHPGGATGPPPALSSPAAQDPASAHTTGTSSTSQTPPPAHSAHSDSDSSETILPPVVNDSNSSRDTSHQVTTTTTTTAVKPRPPTSDQSSAFTTATTPTTSSNASSTRTRISAQWLTGKWSTCSTTCGLGAIWRNLSCSTGSDPDCDPAERPPPAQRCYLRPCSMWRVGQWNKCSRSCEGGRRSREVQCFDLRDQRPLRPFHCRAMSSRPQVQSVCNLQPCLTWYTSSWGQCSEVCGGGEQQRMVTCPEEDACDWEIQPSNIQSCNVQPCAQWLTGSWGQCSVSCGGGGGVQHRLIKCVNTKAESEEEVDRSQCDHQLQPDGAQKCNQQQCESAPSGSVCGRDRLTLAFCHTLRVLGRCHLANVRAQCCQTCGRGFRPVGVSRH